jgi:hypothetical protein
MTNAETRLRGTASGGILRAQIVVGAGLHETQDRGDFCG